MCLTRYMLHISFALSQLPKGYVLDTLHAAHWLCSQSTIAQPVSFRKDPDILQYFHIKEYAKLCAVMSARGVPAPCTLPLSLHTRVDTPGVYKQILNKTSVCKRVSLVGNVVHDHFLRGCGVSVSHQHDNSDQQNHQRHCRANCDCCR